MVDPDFSSSSPKDSVQSLLRFAEKDLSSWTLLFSNLGILIFFIREDWSLLMILWIYWSQSVIIGFFNFLRIMLLKEFSTEGLLINDRPVQPTEKTKRITAFFFALHYGFFHLIYAVFLLTAVHHRHTGGIFQSRFILWSAAIFFFNHLFSFSYNKGKDSKTPNLGTIMFFPYARIIPLHLIILFGWIIKGISALLFFTLLKTIADLIMHVVEHKIVRRTGF